MRYVRSLAPQGRPWGLFISRAVPSVCIFMLLLRALAAPLRLPVPPSWAGQSVPIWCSVGATNLERAATHARLEQYTGHQLANVRYPPGHNFHHEWVYNRADIDHAKVVWARYMAPGQYEELIKYFHDRRVWLVEPNESPPKLTPYGAAKVGKLLALNVATINDVSQATATPP